jgi:ABC-type sulfate/molybdate transport systems ATPase subunit
VVLDHDLTRAGDREPADGPRRGTHARRARRPAAPLPGPAIRRRAAARRDRARAIAKQPEILLCDEPTGALDSRTGILVLEAIETIHRELGTTTVPITHNAVIADMADRVVVLGDGRIQQVRRDARRRAASELSW